MNSDKTSLHIGAGHRSGMFKLRPNTHVLDAKVLIRSNVKTFFYSHSIQLRDSVIEEEKHGKVS